MEIKEPNIKAILAIHTQEDFLEQALQVFRFQYHNNTVYKEFVDLLKIDVTKVSSIDNIPFLPISFFKSHKVLSTSNKVEKTFLSSGTTQSSRSKHHVTDLSIYKQSFTKAFELFFGQPRDLAVLCLLPSYQEQGDSSLIYMTDELVKQSNNNLSGYYINDDEKLFNTIEKLNKDKSPFVLFGVSYALLDYVDKHKHQLSVGSIIETGGMKGRRKELTKKELHTILQNGFGTKHISSEYGMTELLSQGYSLKDQTFYTPPWLHIALRDTDDPLTIGAKSGLINVIDLANIYSCSFIATDDVGRQNPDGGFEVLGRYDYADVRGCNLLVQ